MKQFIAPTYTFTPGASGVGTVDLSGISSFNVKYLVAIINQTRGVVIYSTGSTTLGFTSLSGTTLTLSCNTSSMSGTDVLQVIYDTTPTVNLGTLNGASTAANQTTANTTLSNISTYTLSISNQLPPTLGPNGSLNSLSVTLASDSSPIALKGNSRGQYVRLDYTSTNVTTSAYTQLIASTSQTYSAVEIFDSSGQTLLFSIGGAGAEIDQFIIFPGGNGRIPYSISSGSRIAIKALSGLASVGEISINLYV